MNIFDACIAGSLEAFKSYSIEELKSGIRALLDEEGRFEFPRKRFVGANLIRSSNIDILRHIFNTDLGEEMSKDLSLLYFICVNQAVYDGQLNTVKYLVEECPYRNEEKLRFNYETYCKISALRGNDFCLIYFLNKFPYRSEIDINNHDIFYNAAQSKRSYKIIKYLIEKSRFNTLIDFSTWNKDFLKHLIEIGNVEVLEYLLFNSPVYNQFDNELCYEMTRFRFKVVPINIHKSRSILHKASKRRY